MRGLFSKLRVRSAFTLMEVNLAIFIMSVGVLAMVSLYPLGYRESEQAREDVRSAALANQILDQISSSLSSRVLKWSEWRNLCPQNNCLPSRGWLAYCDNSGIPKNKGSVNSEAGGVIRKLMPGQSVTISDNDLTYAVVAAWGLKPDVNSDGKRENNAEDHSRIVISCRVARRAAQLFSQPVYYTEVHFQGDQEVE